MFEKLLSKLDAKIQKNEDRTLAFITDTNESLRNIRHTANASQAPDEGEDQEDQDAQIPSHSKKPVVSYDGDRPTAPKKSANGQDHVPN